MHVRELVHRKKASVVTITPAATVGDAARLLLQHGVGGLPVVDGHGRLAGFVGERDLVEALDRRGGDVRSLPISLIMRQPPTCSPDDTLAAVMARMTRERTRHLVVSDGGRVSGIISVGDIVKHRLDELETETGVLRDYVAAQRAATGPPSAVSR